MKTIGMTDTQSAYTHSLIGDLAVVIILYNPSEREIRKLSNYHGSIYKHVIIIDNSPTSSKIYVEKFLDKFQYYHFPENIGVAKAYNIALKRSHELQIDWLLLMDQDSEFFATNIIKIQAHIIKYNIKLSDVGILAALPHPDPESIIYPSSEIEYDTVAISSGSLINVKIATQLNGFDEKLFIDTVDCEYCFRVLLAGKRIIKCLRVPFKHAIGSPKVVKILKWNLLSYNHSPIRRYYLVRNNFELFRKYYFSRRKDIQNIVWYSFRMWVLRQILLIFYEDNKMKKLFFSLKGFLHFCIRKFGK
jgi:rhamnosyltransferase